MRILLDECIPRTFRNHLAPHDCRTVPEEGWAGTKNGELLSLAEESAFEAFVTIDRGIEYQQNLGRRSIAVVLIQAQSNRLADLVPHIPEILKVLLSLKPGAIAKVGIGANL